MIRAHGTMLAKPLNPSHFCAGPLATLNLSHLNSVLSELLDCCRDLNSGTHG